MKLFVFYQTFISNEILNKIYNIGYIGQINLHQIYLLNFI